MNVPLRVCTICKTPFPETAENFRERHKNGRLYFYSQCRACEKAYKNKHYHENREEILEYKRSYYYDNLEKERKRSREIMQKLRTEREGYREYEASRRKEARERDKERYAARDAAWRERNREKINSLSMAFYYRHRDRILEGRRVIAPRKKFKSATGQFRTTYIRNRRARKLGSVGFHTEEDVYIQLERQNGRCYYCRKPIEESGYDVDHVMPLSKGGSNWPANIVCACPSCNRSKSDKAIWEWQDFWFNHVSLY